MTRPTLVIGLGGTGQWILTFLKKELLEIGEGKMPPGVKLLCFDTTDKSVAQLGKIDDKDRQTDSEIKLGSVKLEPGIEFIPIGDNVYDLAKQIKQGQEGITIQQHPHIVSWFDAKEMLTRHSGMAFNLKEGAGQIRSFGRMAIFSDLANGPKGKIRARILAALRNLKNEVSGQQQLEVIIIASFAGGTGAGMFIDMGILARHEAAALVQKNLCVRGFYILPRVFAAQDVEMKARAFAAWRELDRFLMIGQKFGQRKMEYSSEGTGLNVNLEDRIFDVCYLVDAIGDGKNSLENIAPEKGLFPMVSDVISTIMDSKAGQLYTQYITSNLAGKLDNLPRAPYHSAIGAYTIKVPVYYDLQVYAHKFALDILKKLTEPNRNVATKLITGVAYDKNEENQNSSGHQAALEFLRARSSADFGLIKDERVNTVFTHLVADITESDKVQDQAFIQNVALMNLDSRAFETGKYLGALVNISDDETGKKIKADVQNELNLPLFREVPSSRMAKDNPDSAYQRITNSVPKFMTEHYGHKLADGTDRPGKYGAALKACESYQVERYRDMLYLWLGATLNGTVDDVERAKGAKIGYVQGVLTETAKIFGNFIEFFNNVRKERTERLVKLNLTQATSNALSQYKNHKADKCWLTVTDSFVHPRAHMKQINYLRAEQVLIDHRKYDLLLGVLIETADAMKFITEATLGEVNKWIEYLVLGNSEKQITGLYKYIEGSLDLAEANHFLDGQLEKVQKIIGEQPYNPDKKKIANILDRTKWQITSENAQIKIGLTVDLVKADGNGETSIRFLNSGERATENNLRSILSLGEGIYADMPQLAPLAKLLMESYPNSNDLAEAVNLMAEPLYEKSVTLSDPKSVSCYIRVDTTNLAEGRERADRYMKDLKDRINELHPLAVETDYQLLPSDNKFRMTIMRSDDLLLSEGFNMYSTCKAAYEQVMRSSTAPAEHLQIFPAERNAAFYEKMIYDVLQHGNYRILHPSVVALLEDRLVLQYFFQALAFDFIRKERVNQQDIYMLDLPGSKQPIKLNKISSRPGEYMTVDLIEVIDVFVNKRSSVENDQYYIDIDKVGNAIQTRINEIGREGAIERMQLQIDSPDGIVNTFRQKVEKEREDKRPTEKLSLAVDYDDLVNLSTVIYKNIISTLS